jgi:DNA polymerase (family X)
MTEEPLADALAELAALLRAARADRFRVRAYERAARVARAAAIDLDDLEPAELRRLRGIGEAMAGLIAEHRASGRIGMLDDLRAEHPPGFGALLTLPLVGVRDARKLTAMGIDGPDALRAALDAAADALAGPAAPGAFDERSTARLREALRRVPAATDARLTRPAARREARELATALEAHDEVDEVHVAGAVRRGLDLIDDLDLVVVAAAEGLRAAARDCAAVVRVLAESDDRVDVLAPSGHLARLHPAAPDELGHALLLATGPTEHLDALVDRGLAREAAPADAAPADPAADPAVGGTPHADAGAAAERRCYARVGLPWLPPEVRDDPEALTRDAAPDLIRVGHLQGDLHVHSDFSGDGVDSAEEMVRAAAGRGYTYLALTDHAENLTINGMPRETVLVRRRTIAELQTRHPHLRVLDGAELNIDLEGALDYDLDFLLAFDLCVASVHSHMDRGAAVQTERILAAIAHPAVHVIGHPTGRIIGRRPGYPIDLAAIAQAAAETGTALEVNGSPSRLDLDGPMVRAAREAGALLSLASDAHSTGELAYAEHAVATARHGWAEVGDVLNARDLDGLLAFTAAKRGGA